MRRLALLALLAAAPLSGQSRELVARCTETSLPEYCQRLVEAAPVLQPRLAIALAGGNPVPGTASTLGMRLGALPRLSLALRVSAAAVEVGGIERRTSPSAQSFAVPALNLDGSIGLFSGFSLAPTIGGFASVDLLASAGRIPLPEGEGFSGSATSWSAGARIGILRESFTAPGVSVSGMYRRVSEVEFGDPSLEDSDAYFRLGGLDGWSLRAAASKRLLGFGLTGGVGYDRYAGDLELRLVEPAGGPSHTFTEDDLESSRATVFGNASFTLLILHLVGEVGWQSGGDANAGLPTDRVEKAGLYGGLALRLSL